MKHKVPHSLGLAQAKKVADAALKSYAERFSEFQPTVIWNSETRGDIGFTAKGIHLKGAVEVLEDAIELELEVPFLLKPFQKKAISVIEKEIQKWIAKSSDGKL